MLHLIVWADKGGIPMGFLQEVAYTLPLGFPVIGYRGTASYLPMVATALVVILTRRKIVKMKGIDTPWQALDPRGVASFSTPRGSRITPYVPCTRSGE